MNFDAICSASASQTMYSSGLFLKKNLELHLKSNEAVLKNQVLAADGIELPAFNKKG